VTAHSMSNWFSALSASTGAPADSQERVAVPVGDVTIYVPPELADFDDRIAIHRRLLPPSGLSASSGWSSEVGRDPPIGLGWRAALVFAAGLAGLILAGTWGLILGLALASALVLIGLLVRKRRVLDAPLTAGDEPGSQMHHGEAHVERSPSEAEPRCPPNWHWDEAIGGCIPNSGGPEIGVREPLRPRRPGPTLIAEAEADRDD
jgi:hypothetical protein